MEEILKTELNIGIEKPIKILFVTDSHITKTNDSDTEAHKKLEQERTKVFYNEGGKTPHEPEYYLRESIKMAEDMGALLVLGGDMVDIQTNGNFEIFNSIIEGHDMMYTPGGHEHQKRCVRTVEEAGDFYKTTREKLKKLLPRFDLDFDNRIINGLNIMTVDSSLDYFNERTVKRFKEELGKGLPCIVFSHDPLTDEYLVAEDPKCRYENLSKEDYRISREMFDLLETHPFVKAYFAGHNHENKDGKLKNGNPHIITQGLFAGTVRLIEIH